MAQVSYGTITITDTNDIESIYMEYAQSTSNQTAPASGWDTDIPTWRQGYYIWQRTVTKMSGVPLSSDSYGEPICLTGSTGSTGATGRGVSSIVTTYCNYGTGEPAASYSGWQSTVPTYDSTKPNYWVKTVITYTTGTPTTDTTIYKDNGITNATSTAAAANSTAQAASDKADDAWNKADNAETIAGNANSAISDLNQYFWRKKTASTNVPAGSYVTNIPGTTYESNPAQGGFNSLVQATGIFLRNGITTLSSWTGTALTFNNPSSGNAQLIIGANGTLQSGNYTRGSDSKFSSNGTKIDLINGDIITKYFRVSQGLETGLSAGVYVHGTIEALDGTIGKFTINAKAIYSGTHDTWNKANTNGIFIGTNDTNYYVSGGPGANWWIRDDGHFQFGGSSGITYNGTTLSIPAANVSGALTAATMETNLLSALHAKINALTTTTATIGSWTISKGVMQHATVGGSGGVWISADTDTPSNVTVGNSGAIKTWRLLINNTFGVTTAGKLYASGADISGAITASSLKINGTDYINQIPTISSKASGDAEYSVEIIPSNFNPTATGSNTFITLTAKVTKLGSTSDIGTVSYQWYGDNSSLGTTARNVSYDVPANSVWDGTSGYKTFTVEIS